MIPDELKPGISVDARARADRAGTAINRSRQARIESLPVVRRVARRSGIWLHSIRYWSDVLTAWSGKAQKMDVRYDPRDLSRIYLRAPDGDYYDVSYRDLRRPPISLGEYQLALKHLHKIKHAEVDEEAIFRVRQDDSGARE